jgi:hypothetical protein
MTRREALAAVAASPLALTRRAGAAPARPFRLGFTPFPYDISFEAIDFSYAALARDADLVVHSLDEGVPWDEALEDAPFPPKVRSDWEDRAHRTPRGHAVYVQLNPLNLLKSGIAEDLSARRSSEWAQRPLDDARVVEAFTNYCERAIATFRPQWLGFIESNLLRTNSPAAWPRYVSLHRQVRAALKRRRPRLPIFSTWVTVALVEGIAPEHRHSDQMAALRDLLPLCDVFALSHYPYMSALTAERLPADMLDKLARLASGKPIAIAESGYPAAEFAIQNGALRFRGTPEKQEAFVRGLLEAAQRHRFLFVNNFVIRDYEPLWRKIGSTDLAAVWKNTGLYDAAGHPRPALRVWREALARPYRR